MLVYLQGQCPCLTSVAIKDVVRPYLLVNKIVLKWGETTRRTEWRGMLVAHNTWSHVRR